MAPIGSIILSFSPIVHQPSTHPGVRYTAQAALRLTALASAWFAPEFRPFGIAAGTHVAQPAGRPARRQAVNEAVKTL